MKKKPPVQQQRLFAAEEYIEEHKQALEELSSKPTMLPTTHTIFDICLDRSMVRYHEVAIKVLESGVDPSTTIDALSEDELIEYMRREGYFI